MENFREQRGLQIVEKGNQVKRLDASTYRVKSENGAGSYLVVIQGSEYRCECPDWKFRGEFLPDKACKHIVAVKASQALRQSVSTTSIDLTTKPEECRICKSSDLIRSGTRKLKNGLRQLYFCKSCGYKFSVDEGFSKMKSDPKIVVSALDLFFKGLSYRKIVDHIKQNYHMEYTHPAILKWVRKYTDLVKVKWDDPDTSKYGTVRHQLKDDPLHGVIHIGGSRSKSQEAFDTFLGAFAMNLLREMLQDHSGAIVKLSVRQVHRIMSQAGRAAGLMGRVSPHVLRKKFSVTLKRLCDEDAKGLSEHWLGHSIDKTTRAYNILAETEDDVARQADYYKSFGKYLTPGGPEPPGPAQVTAVA
jgi:transposase-like protein